MTTQQRFIDYIKRKEGQIDKAHDLGNSWRVLMERSDYQNRLNLLNQRDNEMYVDGGAEMVIRNLQNLRVKNLSHVYSDPVVRKLISIDNKLNRKNKKFNGYGRYTHLHCTQVIEQLEKSIFDRTMNQRTYQILQQADRNELYCELLREVRKIPIWGNANLRQITENLLEKFQEGSRR